MRTPPVTARFAEVCQDAMCARGDVGIGDRTRLRMSCLDCAGQRSWCRAYVYLWQGTQTSQIAPNATLSACTPRWRRVWLEACGEIVTHLLLREITGGTKNCGGWSAPKESAMHGMRTYN